MSTPSVSAGALRLSGPLTIRRVAELRDALSTALAAENSIIVELPEGSDADISFVQLLIAARKSAHATGKSLRLAQPASGPLADVLAKGGFLSAGADNFWTSKDKLQ